MNRKKIVSIHSFRGGTGKSNTTANLAAQVALAGKRVGVVDTDIQSPGIHVLFGLDEHKMGKTLNDFLYDRCEIGEVALSIGENIIDPVKVTKNSIKNACDSAGLLITTETLIAEKRKERTMEDDDEVIQRIE